MNMHIIVHADDFGITQKQSEKILACSTACGGYGALNSTSALVNSPAFFESAALIKPFVEAGSIRLGWHINMLEGPCCAPAAEVPLLVDETGLFNRSFTQLLRAQEGEFAREFGRQVERELAAQLALFLTAFPESKDALCIDGHQHIHMIPAILDALLKVVHAFGCTISYLRIPVEPLSPYVSSPHLWLKIPPVNIVKRTVLARLRRKNAAALSPYEERSAVFCGIVLSGHMKHAANQVLLGSMTAIARNRGLPLEMLFHPGGIENTEQCLNPRQSAFNEFYLSDKRDEEAQALAILEGMMIPD